jgi:hypothetical protein
MANTTAIIASNRISPLIMPEEPGQGTIRYLIPYGDINALGTTGASDTLTLLLGPTPTDWMVTGAFADVATNFISGTTGTLTMTVGTTTQANAFLAATTILNAGPIVPANGAYSTNLPASSFGTTSLQMQVLFTSGVTGTLTGLTAGFATVSLRLKNPNSIP